MAMESHPRFHTGGTPEPVGQELGQTHVKISRNPFRRSFTAPVAPTLPQLPSEDTQLSISGRVKPVRPVFPDLPTAHSSITSGTARSKTRQASSNLSGPDEEEDSIPLQDLDKPLRRAAKEPYLDQLPNLPLLPQPAATIQRRFNSQSLHSDASLLPEDDNFVHHSIDQAAAPSNAIGLPSSVFFSVKSAFASSPNPATASTPSPWPGASRSKGKQRALHAENGSSIYHSGLGAAPSGSLPPCSANRPALDPPRKHGYDSYNNMIPFLHLHSSPAPDGELPPPPRQSTRTTRILSSATSSLPEGSTVGNIYKHYAQSESSSDNGQSEYDLGDMYSLSQQFPRINNVDPPGLPTGFPKIQEHQSALHTRRQQREKRASSKAGAQPPSFSLPSLPTPSARQLASSSERIANSSSYDDTNNLLGLPAPSQRVEINVASRDLGSRKKSQDVSNIGNFSYPAMSHLGPNNPFRAAHAPKVLVSQAEDYEHEDHRHYNQDSDRLPLEREVSKALRRASGFSTYSNGSIATSVRETYAQYQSNVSSSNGLGLLNRQIEQNQSNPDVVDEEMRAAAARAQEFYEKGAISSKQWFANQKNEVRIPIKHDGQLPRSPPLSPDDEADLRPPDHFHDLNDWETVGESGFGTEYKSSISGMLGPDFANRAGSSIADTSDDGSISTHIPQISEYGSTERIAQHPGNIKYHGDYRQRDLKDTNIPVFLPVFREHKVNGYLADSNRTRPPPSPYDYNPTPLNRKHNNPFKSPPPKVMASSVSKPFTRDQPATSPTQLPTPTSVTTYISSDDNATPEHRGPRSKTAMRPLETPARPSDWMDDFGDPGPEINHTGPQFLKPISRVAEEDRPSSWQHMMIYASGGKVEGFDDKGARLVESPFGIGGGRGVMKDHSFPDHRNFEASSADSRMNSFDAVKTYARGNASFSQRDRSPLVKGPPGAFYQGLSRTRATRAQSQTVDRPTKARDSYRQLSAKEHPTNVLRQLSLVSNHRKSRPVTPLDKADPSRSAGIPNDFVYRSPLAPVKRSTWKQLYTPDQLTDIREAAQADGIYDTGVAAAPHDGAVENITHQTKEGNSRRHLYESPRLSKHPEPSVYAITCRQKKISFVVLCLCNLFPPLLLAFGLGGMDGVMKWWTEGESETFVRRHKRLAFWFLFAWSNVVFVALVVFLVLWFTKHHS